MGEGTGLIRELQFVFTFRHTAHGFCLISYLLKLI